MAIWEELLFGSGFWLGLLIQLAMLFVVTYAVPRFGFIGSIYCVMMVFVYNENLTANTINNWGMIIMGVSIMPLIYIGTKK